MTTAPVRCSVIIPVYNHADLTTQCIDTILADPPRTSFELIVVDDASTDSTQDVLHAYSRTVRVVTHRTNSGFARSCNDGAAAALGEYFLFLNNDTIPQPGWLDALVDYGDTHPRAAVIGSKLLFPDGRVQHAGVVICQDGWARHLYAGFPADHPSVNKSRQFQVVSAACAAIRRSAFFDVGGFDEAFLNGHEDVDLCLKLRELGWEVHLCHASVLYHLESVSRGKESEQIDENGRLYFQRWAERTLRDDLTFYATDGLLRVRYDREPMLIEVAPELARTTETEVGSPQPHIEEEAQGDGAASGLADLPSLSATEYDVVKRRLQEVVATAIPRASTVAVVSKGDGDLLRLGKRRGWHFPRARSGAYAGHHPADSSAAIAQLEELRSLGADFFLVPATSFWWFSFYGDFTRYMEERYQIVVHDPTLGVIFNLSGGRSLAGVAAGNGESVPPVELVRRIRRVIDSLLPSDAPIVLASEGIPELAAFDRQVLPFPLTDDGDYLPSDLATPGALVRQLSAAPMEGVRYFVVPTINTPLLDDSPELSQFLRGTCRLVAAREQVCVVFELPSADAAPLDLLAETGGRWS